METHRNITPRRTSRTTQQTSCSGCGTYTDFVICDDCNRGVMSLLLSSEHWVHNAKTRKGDLPGETLFDTIKREFALANHKSSDPAHN